MTARRRRKTKKAKPLKEERYYRLLKNLCGRKTVRYEGMGRDTYTLRKAVFITIITED